MFFKHLITLATIALLSMSGTGKPAIRLPAQVAQLPAQVQSPVTPDKEQADHDPVGETQDKSDGDNSQAGDQATPDLTDSADLTDTADVTNTAGITDSPDMTDETKHQDGQEADKAQEEDQNPSDAGAEADQGQVEQDTLPASKPAITADAAQKIAEAHLKSGMASKVELDEENGKLVYSVQIGKTDVKVDAMIGAVLSTDDAED